MSHYDIAYDVTKMTREAVDEKAIQDAKEFMGQKVWETVLYECGRAEVMNSVQACRMMNMAISFAGVSGRPFHAIARKYFLSSYRKWMAEPDEENPKGLKTDLEGFRLDGEDA